MARRKTLPESLRAKHALAGRLASLRLELFGDRGGPEMARRLGIPVRTWYNYEGGVTVPAEVALKIIELTSVEPVWLLNGKGPKFRQPSSSDLVESKEQASASTVGELLRTALQLLENSGPSLAKNDASFAVALSSGPSFERPHSSPARKELLDAQRENRCLPVVGNAMAPLVADGASVAYSREADEPAQLDGKMVVAWLGSGPVVRWYQHCGRYALLRAENPDSSPQQLIDFEATSGVPRIRRVLWIDTPH